ncbi:hypothetical protein, partial [Clostridium perfringens]
EQLRERAADGQRTGECPRADRVQPAFGADDLDPRLSAEGEQSPIERRHGQRYDGCRLGRGDDASGGEDRYRQRREDNDAISAVAVPRSPES